MQPLRAASDDAVAALEARVAALESEVRDLKAARVAALESELAALRRDAAAAKEPAEPAPPPPPPRVPALQGAMAARAALGALQGKTPAYAKAAATTYDAEEVEALGGEAFFFDDAPKPGKNDAFLDDALEDLLEIGGDPSFLEQARGDDEPWDGVEDDSAHFFDEE